VELREGMKIEMERIGRKKYEIQVKKKSNVSKLNKYIINH
jgi:hypothetical protein